MPDSDDTERCPRCGRRHGLASNCPSCVAFDDTQRPAGDVVLVPRLTELEVQAARLLEIDQDSSREWAESFIRKERTAPHEGDCPVADVVGPVTCSRCVYDEFMAKAATAPPSPASAVLAILDAWQPIETAPRDETPVDLWSCKEGKRYADCRWRWVPELGRPYWFARTGGRMWNVGTDEHFTHWRPLPEPPAEIRAIIQGADSA